MGILIVAIIGAIMGWLVSIVLDRRGASVAAIVLAGAVGALAGAALGGEVPLSVGVSPAQLLAGTFGAAIAIVTAVLSAYRRASRTPRSF